MSRVSRILDTNLVKTAGAVLSSDSDADALPVRYLLDQLRSKVWRSDTGWIITAGYNDVLDLNRAGPGNFTVTVTAGTYNVPAALCEAIRSALETADAAPAWNVTYSTSTLKFTISSDIAFKLNLGTVNALAVPLWEDLGWNTGVASGTALSFASDNTSSHGRHYISLDLGSAQAHTAAFLLDTNISASGNAKLHASASSIAAALSAPDATQTLSGSGELLIAYFGSQSYRYLVFVIEDASNTDGFSEVGIAFVGTYREPSIPFSVSYEEEGDDLSEMERATEGALYGDLKPEAPAWTLEYLDFEEADADIFRAHRTATPKGKCFGFAFDAGVDNTDFAYGFRDGPLPISAANGDVYFNARFTLREALP